MWFILYLSQRIANQGFYLGVVSADDQGYAWWVYDGPSATTGKLLVVNSGVGEIIASGSIPSTGSYAISEIELFFDEIIDFTTCGNTVKARKAFQELCRWFMPARVKVCEYERERLTEEAWQTPVTEKV